MKTTMEASLCNLTTAKLGRKTIKKSEVSMFFQKVQIGNVMPHVCRVLFIYSFLFDKSTFVVAHKHKNR